MSGFSQLPLPTALQGNLDALDHHHMTPTLADRDLIAQAETGIGLLNGLDAGTRQVQALVRCLLCSLGNRNSARTS